MRVRYKPVCCGDDLKKSYNFKDFLHRHLTAFILSFSVIILTSLYLGGILTYLFEEDFTNYSYPLDIVNTTGLVEEIDRFQLSQQHHQNLLDTDNVGYNFIVKALESIEAKDGQSARVVVPLTQFKDFSFSIDINPTCLESRARNIPLLLEPSQQNFITVIIVVKSAVNNYARRQAIRNSWYLNGTRELFSFKTVFMVGKCHEKNTVPSSMAQLNTNRWWSPTDCNGNIQREAAIFGDIVQSSGIDSYYNNTIKTYMTLRWLNERCPSDFSIAIDDDYVFEVENFINFMYQKASETITGIPESANSLGQILRFKDRRYSTDMQNLDSKQTEAGSNTYTSTALGYRARNLVALRQLSKEYVWAGYVRNYVHPLRSVLSKWYISRDDYAFDKYPPFITGGWVLMSFKTIKHLYYATYFTRSFKFDDVYLGILAHKLGLKAQHSENFMCSVDDYLDADPIRPNSTECIGVHDIEPGELEKLWRSRERSLSNLAPNN